MPDAPISPRPSLLHVFAAAFETHESALAFGRPQWEPEPGEDVSDEDYAAWEDRNPQWAMKAELGVRYLDSDFVEVIWNGDGGPRSALAYLSSRLAAADAGAVGNIMPASASTLLLVDDQAFGGFGAERRSTASMVYCGSYEPLR